MDEADRQRMREIDDALAAVPLPRGLQARLAASVEARAGRRQLGVAMLVATAAVVLAFVIGRGSAPVKAPEPSTIATAEPAAAEPAAAEPAAAEPASITASAPAAASRWDGRLEVEPGCEVDGVEVVRVRGDCRLRLASPSLSIDVWGGARLQAADHGVRLVDGVALFHVDRVPPGQPRVRVEVATGAIEVIGTRFVVEQRAAAGHVDLLEGAIELVASDGAVHAIAAGQRLRWDAEHVQGAPAAEAEAAAEPGTRRKPPREPTPVRPAVELDAELERVAALRRAGRYDDAIDVLIRLRRELDDPRVAEVLSFEEGTLRTRADRPAEACAFWRGHLARFGAGDHAASIREHMAAAGCAEP
jgi:ferric-dicitrate binding protein FerR (iron transport regulator)